MFFENVQNYKFKLHSKLQRRPLSFHFGENTRSPCWSREQSGHFSL